MKSNREIVAIVVLCLQIDRDRIKTSFTNLIHHERQDKMANVDLNSAISGLVATEVERALEPYRGLLQRMAEFAGVGVQAGPQPVKRGPGRPRASAGAPSAPARRVVSQDAVGKASNFRDGQAVRYKQGRGSFDATVISINAEQGLLVLRRSKDGKQVERPASKVYSA